MTDVTLHVGYNTDRRIEKIERTWSEGSRTWSKRPQNMCRGNEMGGILYLF